jgi:hypothetical protein
MNRLQKRSKNKTNKYYLLGYKGESICILLNAKGKVITGYFVRFAKEKRLACDLSSDNNSEDKPLLKRGRVTFPQTLDNFIRNESNYQPLPLAKDIGARKPNIDIDLDTSDLSFIPLSLFIKDCPENEIS